MPTVPKSPNHAEAGRHEYPTSISVKMQPGPNGGFVDLSPETVTRMIGCDPDKIGNCAAALSLDSMEITGANVPIDSHVILSTTDGDSINSHSANHVDANGSVQGVHANIRHGNTKTGLGIKIPLQPHAYLQGGQRHENMAKALQRQANWNGHLNKNKEDILGDSTHEIKHGVDADGNSHSRVLIKQGGKDSPLGKLVEMNPKSTHAIMKIYNEDKLTKVDGHIVMDSKHADTLAETLAETLAPHTPISKGGLRIQIKPMPHAVDHLDQPLTAQLDVKFNRTPVDSVLKDETHKTAVTTEDLQLTDPNQPKKSVEKVKEEKDAKIWGASLGTGPAPKQVTETAPPAAKEIAAPATKTPAPDKSKPGAK